MLLENKHFPQMVFDHWATVGSDPLDPISKAGEIIYTGRLKTWYERKSPCLEKILRQIMI